MLGNRHSRSASLFLLYRLCTFCILFSIAYLTRIIVYTLYIYILFLFLLFHTYLLETYI